MLVRQGTSGVPLPAVDWNTFFDAVAGAMKLYMDTVKMPESERPVFVEDFPRQTTGDGYDTSLDVILWSIDASEMAPTDNAGQRIPNGIHLRGKRPSPDKVGYFAETWGWWELMTAKFTIYAKSNRRVNELTSWFHRMLMVYTFGYEYFKGRGVTYFKFDKRQADEKTQEFGQELYRHSLFYKVRLDLRDEYEAKTIEDVAISLAARPGGAIARFEVKSDGQ